MFWGGIYLGCTLHLTRQSVCKIKTKVEQTHVNEKIHYHKVGGGFWARGFE